MLLERTAFWTEVDVQPSLCMTVVLLLYYGVLNIVFGPVTHRSTAFCQRDRSWDQALCSFMQ